MLCLLLQAMQPSMPLQGKRVLVHAGAGGVGSFAIQVGRHRLPTTAAAAAAGKAEMLLFKTKLGAATAQCV
jgi:NADPH:quinone reductase-like Zn-dependent oxidoreductase